MVQLIVVFSRLTLKPLRIYPYKSAILNTSFRNTQMCLQGGKKKNLFPQQAMCLSTGLCLHRTPNWSEASIETKPNQTSCLASCEASTNELESRWWPKEEKTTRLHKCVSWSMPVRGVGTSEAPGSLTSFPIKVLTIFHQRSPSKSSECSHSRKRISLGDCLGSNRQYLHLCPRFGA